METSTKLYTAFNIVAALSFTLMASNASFASPGNDIGDLHLTVSASDKNMTELGVQYAAGEHLDVVVRVSTDARESFDVGVTGGVVMNHTSTVLVPGLPATDVEFGMLVGFNVKNEVDALLEPGVKVYVGDLTFGVSYRFTHTFDSLSVDDLEQEAFINVGVKF